MEADSVITLLFKLQVGLFIPPKLRQLKIDVFNYISVGTVNNISPLIGIILKESKINVHIVHSPI